LPPIEEFEKNIPPKTQAFLICNPGNPTGFYLYSKEELEALRDIVKKTRFVFYLLMSVPVSFLL